MEATTTARRKGRPRKNTAPDLPTVATHGTTIDHSQVLDALQSVEGFPVPPIEVVIQWNQQARAEVLRWAHHTNRNTEPLPPVLDAWLVNGTETTPTSTGEPRSRSRFAAPDAAPSTEPDSDSMGWLLDERPWVKGPKIIHTLTVPIEPERAVELMNQQAQLYQELSLLKEEKKEVDADLNGKIKGVEVRLSRLTNAVLHGNEDASVECQWQHDYTNGIKRLIRLDTGVVIDHSELSEQERQIPLALEED